MIGQLIGNYKIVRKIGDGGMGSVFEAVHEAIGGSVAIKVLHPNYCKDSVILARFFNEARAVNIIKHPGLVRSIDYGQLPDGTAYIVMEYCSGESLTERLTRVHGPLGADALRIGRQIATALDAAHSKGIIHRDLKPDNIILVPDSEAAGGERAKILDFGIAKIIEKQQAGADNAILTGSGAILGTPRYMSPEQCQGSGQVDGKTDVYALGIIMFIMLTGRAPFLGKTPTALMAQHVYDQPPSLRPIEPAVHPQAEALVLAMLAKDPKERPSMLEVATTLEQLGVYATSSLPAIIITAEEPEVPAAQSPPPTTDPSGAGISSRPSLSGFGQAQDRTRIKSGPTKVLTLVVPLALVSAVLGFGAYRVLSQRSAVQPTPQLLEGAVPQARQIVWEIQTTPPGALVIRVSDGAMLGKTPWRSTEPSSSGAVAMTLRQTGYSDKSVVLYRSRDCSENVRLEPLSKAAPAKPAAGDDDSVEPSSSGKKKKKPRHSGRSDSSGSAPATDPAN
jgi:serine/threonine-protein kinase